jgi:hypothetical protein
MIQILECAEVSGAKYYKTAYGRNLQVFVKS